MGDQHNPNIPALTNTIAEDVVDIKENLEFHKDCFEAICSGWANDSAASLKVKTITYDTDTDISAKSWVVDEDNMVSDLATKVPTQQSVKAYADTVQADVDGFPDDLKNVTATAAELNKTDGLTATTTELNTVADGAAARNGHKHSNITINAGTGLSGGGDLSANRTFNHDSHTGDVTGATALTIGAAKVTQAKLKTSTQDQSYDIPIDTTHKFSLTGGQYCFRPTIKGEMFVGDDSKVWLSESYPLTTSYATVIVLKNEDVVPRFGYVLHRYVTSSGEVYWIFILRNKTTKEIIGISSCPDHPCFGGSQDPDIEPHPFIHSYDPNIHEIIVINPTKEEVLELKKKTNYNKCLAQVISEDCEIDETTEPDWPTEAVTVGLPPDWEEKPIGESIEPIKKVIPKPVYVKTAALKIKKITPKEL